MSTTTQQSRFLSLPSEIRTFCFQQLFSSSTVKPRLRGSNDFRDPSRSHVTNIFLVSKQIRQESELLFFRYCLFDFSMQLRRNVFDQRSRHAASEIIKKTYMSAAHLHRIHRAYGGDELLHCLSIVSRDTFRPQMGMDIFPGLDVSLLQIQDLTIEYWIHAAQLKPEAERLRPRDRHGLANLQELRLLQSQSDLSWNLHLRIVYWNDKQRLPPNEDRRYDWNNKTDWPMFDIGRDGKITRFHGEANRAGIRLLDDLVDLLGLDCGQVTAELNAMRKRAEEAPEIPPRSPTWPGGP